MALALLLFALLCCCCCFKVGFCDSREVHIVYMGSLPTHTTEVSPTSLHLRLLQEAVEEESVDSASLLVTSYRRSFNGFAAKITAEEALKLAGKEGVISVFPSQPLLVKTTRSWDFLGLLETATRSPTAESNTIIGVLDSGADPSSKSFGDRGFSLPPEKWTGSCNGGINFTCKNKLIGAQSYITGSADTALDYSGHGTHTASTAAGSVVEGASLSGLARGRARGAVPSARIAIYRVCIPFGTCPAHAILAAFDDAIADGVDIISISVGGAVALPFNEDPVAIGSFHAMSKGVLVVQSAGNEGPAPGSVCSAAPWLLTVAASNTDRGFITKVEIGNGTLLTGNTVNPFPSTKTGLALVYGTQVSSICPEAESRACVGGCLERHKIAAKLVICDSAEGVPEAAAYGARGIILNSGDGSRLYPLPAVVLDDLSYRELLAYHNSTRDPRGRILKGETVFDQSAPHVVPFSSRGPNPITPDLLKPDVTAPGIHVLAAFPPYVSPTGLDSDHRRLKFNLLSGTSMSCPHAAGAAAYVKSFHPDWSPSAIKSALMTTASSMRGSSIGEEFSAGAGQINPTKAVDPGLVYEISEAEYLEMLCGLGVRMGSDTRCSGAAEKLSPAQLNYPALIFRAPVSEAFSLALNRTATHVGPPNSTYSARSVINSSLVKVGLVPEFLLFGSVSERKEFTVKISGRGLKPGALLSAELVWSDGLHSVRMPIVLYS